MAVNKSAVWNVVYTILIIVTVALAINLASIFMTNPTLANNISDFTRTQVNASMAFSIITLIVVLFLIIYKLGKFMSQSSRTSPAHALKESFTMDGRKKNRGRGRRSSDSE